MALICQYRKQGEERGREGVDRDWERGGVGDSSAVNRLLSFPSTVRLPRSTQSCVGQIAGIGLSSGSRRLPPEKGTNGPLPGGGLQDSNRMQCQLLVGWVFWCGCVGVRIGL